MIGIGTPINHNKIPFPMTSSGLLLSRARNVSRKQGFQMQLHPRSTGTGRREPSSLGLTITSTLRPSGDVGMLVTRRATRRHPAT